MKWLQMTFLALLCSLLLLLGTDIWMAADSDEAGDVTFAGMVIFENVLPGSLPVITLGFYVSALLPLLMLAVNILKLRRGESLKK